MLRRRRLLPVLVATVSLPGAACGLAPVARADGGPQILAYNVPTTVEADVPASFDVTVGDGTSALGPIAWSFGDGSDGSSGALTSHAWAAPGTYTVTVSAADALGLQTSQSFVVDVEPAPTTPSSSTAPPAPAVAPAFSATQSRDRWTRGHGTMFRLALSQSANVSLSFARRAGPGTTAAAAPLGTLVTAAAAGNSTIVFHGELGYGRRLAPGNYVATLIATAGDVSAAPVSLDFTIRRHQPDKEKSGKHARRLRQRDRRR